MEPDKPTLLGLATRGRFQQSSEIPEVKPYLTPLLEFATGAYEKAAGEQPSGWEAAMSLPVLGSVRKSKDLVKLYRGIDKWRRGQQVKKGMHVGGLNKNYYAEMAKTHPDLARRLEKAHATELYTTPRRSLADYYAQMRGRKGSRVLEYHVPKKYIDKHAFGGAKEYANQMDKLTAEVMFKKGLPKEFLKKVHNMIDKGYVPK